MTSPSDMSYDVVTNLWQGSVLSKVSSISVLIIERVGFVIEIKLAISFLRASVKRSID